MSGYCATGSMNAATPPTSMMTIEMTQAKIGRSMKKHVMGCSSGAQFLLTTGRGGDAWSSCASGLGMGTSLRLTVMPARTRWRLETTIQSPA